MGLPGSIAGISEGTRPGLRGAATAGRQGAGVAEVTALFLAFPTWRTNAWQELGPALAGWAGSGATIAAAIVNPAAVGASPPRLDPAQVESLVSGLRAAGATVVLIDPLEDMRTCFEHALLPVA